jgi:predicted ester cyclase
MSASEVQTTLDEYLNELNARGDFARFFTDDVRFDVPGTGPTASGRQEVEQTIRFLHQVAFDAHAEVRLVFADGSHAALEAEFVGTHTGEFGGVPATGNAVRLPYSVIYDFEGDRISALRVYLSVDQLAAQAQAQGQTSTAVQRA